MDNVLLVGRERIEVAKREMLIIATIEPLLKKLRLSLYCPKCYQQGLSDGGLRGNNSLDDARWTLECNCSVRMAENPTAHAKTVA